MHCGTLERDHKRKPTHDGQKECHLLTPIRGLLLLRPPASLLKAGTYT